MKRFLCLIATLYLCFQVHVNAGSRLNRNVIENAVKAAKATVDSAYEYSRKVTIDRVRRNAATPADVLRMLKMPVGDSRSLTRSADYMENAIGIIKKSVLTRRKRSINATDLISAEDLELLSQLTGCSPRHRNPSCRTTPNLNQYRTLSSVCNNGENTRWGSANIPLTRWMPAEYLDDVFLPKGWMDEENNGFVLPNARNVSNQILAFPKSKLENDPEFSYLETIFGQFLDHDMTFTPHSPVIRSYSDGIDCEDTCERTEPCYPIKIPHADPRFGDDSEECIAFSRSAPTCGSGNTGANFGARNTRQQLNTLTSYIDGSNVYGSDEAKAKLLRDLTTDEGRLKVNTKYSDNGFDFLPFRPSSINMCATRARVTNDSNAEEVPCFVAGDDRSNENIVLTSVHTLFMREHNRLVAELKKLNPKWDGEKLYQEARKIVGAFLQIFTYRDFLRHILGPDMMAKKLSTYTGYDKTVDPSISNSFATASFRFAHGMIQPFVFRLNEDYEEHKEFPSPMLHKSFVTPWRVIFEGGVDPIMRGLIGKPSKLNTQEAIMTDELRDRLFKFSREHALDLGALNMQRGRDHALPGYNKWRKFCGLSQPKNLKKLAKVLDNKKLAARLLDLYGTADNIDLWLGGMTEPFVRGARVGPLFACLIATQFKNLRDGDRFWWENKGVFTEAQKVSLREVSLSRVICDNTGITEVPRDPFLYRPRGDGYTPCGNIPKFDLKPWKESDMSEEPQGPPGPRGPPGPPGPPGYAAHVAFSARLGKNKAPSGTPIPFSEVLTNIGYSYNPKKGIFKCMVPGLYEFQFHCTIYRLSASLDLMHNGKRLLHSFTSTHTDYVTASGNTYVSLEKGDKVWLVAEEGSKAITEDSFFSGHLLWSGDNEYGNH